jgi:hypothetical protein
MFRATWIAAEKFLPAPSNSLTILTWKDFPSSAIAGSTSFDLVTALEGKSFKVIKIGESHLAHKKEFRMKILPSSTNWCIAFFC